MKIYTKVVITAALVMTGCQTMPRATPSPVTPAADRTFLTPSPALSVTTYDSGQPVTRYWESIPQDEIRRLLNIPVESAVIEEVTSSGGATLLGSGVNLRKGRYRATYYYYKTKSERCSSNPEHGNIFSGIGIRITADIETTQSGVNIADIMSLALAANRGAARGQLTIEAIGISSSTTSITPYLQAASGLTVDGLRRAVESFGVVKAIAETPSVHLTPHSVYIQARDPEGCFAALTRMRNPPPG